MLLELNEHKEIMLQIPQRFKEHMDSMMRELAPGGVLPSGAPASEAQAAFVHWQEELARQLDRQLAPMKAALDDLQAAAGRTRAASGYAFY